MAMSKKDYQALARAIYEAVASTCSATRRDGSECGGRFMMLSGGVLGCPAHGLHAPQPITASNVKAAVVDNIADVLAADNPRFDRARFVEACETGRTKGMPLVPVSENAPGRTVLDR